MGDSPTQLRLGPRRCVIRVEQNNACVLAINGLRDPVPTSIDGRAASLELDRIACLAAGSLVVHVPGGTEQYELFGAPIACHADLQGPGRLDSAVKLDLGDLNHVA